MRFINRSVIDVRQGLACKRPVVLWPACVGVEVKQDADVGHGGVRELCESHIHARDPHGMCCMHLVFAVIFHWNMLVWMSGFVHSV